MCTAHKNLLYLRPGTSRIACISPCTLVAYRVPSYVYLQNTMHHRIVHESFRCRDGQCSSDGVLPTMFPSQESRGAEWHLETVQRIQCMSQSTRLIRFTTVAPTAVCACACSCSRTRSLTLLLFDSAQYTDFPWSVSGSPGWYRLVHDADVVCPRWFGIHVFYYLIGDLLL